MASGSPPQAPSQSVQGSSWRFILRALRSRNYRLFFGGQSISLIGTWMTRIATSWLVYRLTGSAMLLGVTGFAGQLPMFLLGPFAGVWVDRWDRQRTLIWTQVFSMVQSLLLAALALSGRIRISHIIALSVVQGIVNAFDTPARQAFVSEMIDDRADLPNAIALNSSMVNAARLIGPSIAGVLIAKVGEGYCFLSDGISYIAVIISLLVMQVSRRAAATGVRSVRRELIEGWQYVSGFAPIRSILLLLAVISLVGMSYTVLMPIYASNVLHGGAHTLGFLMAASGCGALAGALVLAARNTVRGMLKILPIAAIGFGVGLTVLSQTRTEWIALGLMFIVGYSMMQHMAVSNTILQTISDEDKRGRVMSYYTMAFLGMAPFGSLFAGAIAARIGVPRTFTFSGLFCVCFGAVFFTRMPGIRRLMRPIYQKLGIVPEIASGIGTASTLRSPSEE
ncbi:MAG TPA: MFS transporter [candidate division Zixibacteria bacterium]|nr:MFS transporter [candidate division Zixibacteria bacterium]